MTPDPKLPPLREALERIAWRETPIHPRGPDDYTVYLPRHLVLGVAAPHDALIRQQEARIAEQDLRVAVLQESLRNLEDDIEGLEEENDAQTRAFCAIPMCDLKPEFFVYREWEAEAGIEFFSTAQEASDAADAAMELAREELAQNGMVDDPEIVYGRVYARCETSKGPAPEHSEHDEVWHFDFEPRLTAELEVVRLRTMVAELERERETFRTAFSVANDQMEHTTSLFLPVEAEKDRLAKKVAELEGELADANDELSHWRRLAVAARDALGRSGGLCGMEREQLTASQIINRLAEMPATEVELAMTSLGVARQNREDLEKFRELAREAAYVPKMYKSDLVRGDQYIVIAARLAALHKEE